MIVILTLLTVLTVAEMFVCHFTLWWLIVLVDRGLFALRRIGAILPVKRLIITEGVAVFLMFLFHLLFSKGNIPWSRMLLTVLFNAVACGIMLWDSIFMVYDTVDIDEEEEEEYL